MTCELCNSPGGELLWESPQVRVVYVDEPGYAGFCRVIWQKHVKEMTDLEEGDRAELMDVVFAVESVLREQLEPLKMNLASIGNVVPHLHWHVIPRFADDPHFPGTVWGKPQRASLPDREISVHSLAGAIAAALD